MSEQWETKLENAITWLANERSTNICLETFKTELDIWKDISGTRTVDSTLEVGSGAGLFSRYLLLSGFTEEAVCLDPLSEGEGPAQNEVVQVNKRLNGVTGETDRVTRLDGRFPEEIPNRAFDMVIFRKALHHIYPANETTKKDVIEGLEIAREHLTDSGWIYILEPSDPTWWFQIIFTMYRATKGLSPRGWENKRQPHEWITLLQESGFKEVRVKKTPLNLVVDRPGLSTLSKSISHRYLITGTPE